MAYLGTALRRAGHDVRVHVREEALVKRDFDWRAAEADLRRLLSEFRPEMVGFSAVTPLVPETAELAELVKGLLGPGVLTVAGGPHPSVLPERTLEECPGIDVVAIGEGEQTIVELAERGARQDVRGIAFRGDGGVMQTPPRPRAVDLDSLGPPEWDDLFDMSYYTVANRWMLRWRKLPAANVRTSRGCTNRCRFCAGHVISGLGLRYHSVDYVMGQILRAVDGYGVRGIQFEDDTLGGDRDRLLALCEAMCRRDLPRRVEWDGCLRVDQAEPELLARMKKAGCAQIEYGFESGSDASLRRLGKVADTEMNRRAVRLTRQAGIRVFANIMVGLPGETEEDFRATLKFVRWARPDILSVSCLAPVPGTSIYDRLSPEQKASFDWSDFTYFDSGKYGVHLPAMPPERFKRLYGRLLRYVVRPHMTHALLRDTPREDRQERRRLRGKLLRFVVRHPIRALRAPW